MDIEYKKSNWNNLKNSWWKILVVSFLGSLFNTIVHGLLPSGTTTLPPSIIVQQGLLPLAFLIYGFIYYALLGCVFVLISSRLQGSNFIKGLKYGLFFGILTIIVYLEPLPSTVTFSVTNILWMLADSIPYIVFGILMGIFLAKDNKKEDSIEIKSNKLLILVIPAIFLIGRLLSYNIFHIYSSYSILPVNTIIWVLTLGLGISIMYYYLLRPGVLKSSPFSTAILFGAMFGIYLFLFNFAYALIVNLKIDGYIDFFIRASIDVLFVSLGIFVYEYLLKIRIESSNIKEAEKDLN
ncbi:hypothetical protein [Methanobacterium sp.]|uniref:hypothetical protein n=1 Tax=Methanobacterium sp. TaxID=2164 RepID=UPI003C729B9D